METYRGFKSRSLRHQDTLKRSVQNSIECVFFYEKPPLSGRFFLFILFVVLSHYSDGICSFLRFSFSKTITIAQKGFLHDKERMIPTGLINEKTTDCTLTNAVGLFLIMLLLPVVGLERETIFLSIAICADSHIGTYSWFLHFFCRYLLNIHFSRSFLVHLSALSTGFELR